MTPGYAIGVDLGGTNLRVALLQGSSAPEPLAQRRELVGFERDPAAVTARLGAAIRALLATAGQLEGDELIPVGIGIAAMLRGKDGMIAHSPHLHWYDTPFGEMMQAELGPRHPVFVYNDVNAITYGEFALGAGRDVDDVLAVFVGTGIGGGIVAGGRLVEGASNCAGEIGHFTVVYGDDAALCACGKRGCVEAYVGGHYVQKRIREELAAGIPSAATKLVGCTDLVTPTHLDAAAADGDDYALDLYAELAPLLAATLSNAVTLLNPARLILGGGMLSRTPVFREHVVAAFEVITIPAALDACQVVDAALGDDAGLIGSATLALRALSPLPSQP